LQLLRRRVQRGHGGLEHAVGQPAPARMGGADLAAVALPAPPAGVGGEDGQHRAGHAVTASATGSSAAARGTAGASKRRTPVPCTWRSQCGNEGSASRCASSARLRSTVAGSSLGAVRLPRLKSSNGGCDCPAPCRSVASACTPGSAGQPAASANGGSPLISGVPARQIRLSLAQRSHQGQHVGRHRRGRAPARR
jgi:hypothetical protein